MQGRWSQEATVFKCFLGDLKIREIYIIGFKKNTIFSLQAAIYIPFQITCLQKIAFKFLCTFKKQGNNFDSYFAFLPSFSLQLKQHQKSADHCSALSFSPVPECFLRLVWLLQIRKEVGLYYWRCSIASILMTLSWNAFWVHTWLCFSPALLPQSNFISKSVCRGCLPCWEVLYHMFVFLAVFLSALKASPTCSTRINSFDHCSGVWALRCCWSVSADTHPGHVNNSNSFLSLLNTSLL